MLYIRKIERGELGAQSKYKTQRKYINNASMQRKTKLGNAPFMVLDHRQA